jgi:peptide/nickel transport system substrate-binding protein
VGFKRQMHFTSFGDLQRRISESYDYDACLLVTSLSEPDPSSYVGLLSSNSPMCRWRPKQSKPATDWEARIDDLLAKQARETNPERRRAAFSEIQRILAEQSPVIPIVARHVSVAANQRVGNYSPSAIFPYSLWNVEELFIRQ